MHLLECLAGADRLRWVVCFGFDASVFACHMLICLLLGSGSDWGLVTRCGQLPRVIEGSLMSPGGGGCPLVGVGVFCQGGRPLAGLGVPCWGGHPLMGLGILWRVGHPLSAHPIDGFMEIASLSSAAMLDGPVSFPLS